MNPRISFFISLLAALCDRPQHLVYRIDSRSITIRVWLRDMGRIIGQKGATVRQLRNLAMELCDLEILVIEPGENLSGISWSGDQLPFIELCREFCKLAPATMPATMTHAKDGNCHEIDIRGGDFGHRTKAAMNQLIHAMAKPSGEMVEVLFNGV